MPLKQISIFLENSPGRLHEVTKGFGEAGINLKALSLADTSGFGVLRLIVSDLAKARRIAMENHWPAKIDDIAVAKIPDVPGSLAGVLGYLFEKHIDVEYMYAFAGISSDGAVMVFRFREHEEGVRVLREHGVEILDAGAFSDLHGEGGQA
jgi:hypothetical protein